MSKSIGKVFYYLMIVSMLVRLFWLVTIEPNGASRALERFPGVDTLEGFLALVVLGGNAGYGPAVVLPASVLMVVFSALTYRTEPTQSTAQEPA